MKGLGTREKGKYNFVYGHEKMPPNYNNKGVIIDNIISI